jgi:hypothetical protein
MSIQTTISKPFRSRSEGANVFTEGEVQNQPTAVNQFANSKKFMEMTDMLRASNIKGWMLRWSSDTKQAMYHCIATGAERVSPPNKFEAHERVIRARNADPKHVGQAWGEYSQKRVAATPGASSSASRTNLDSVPLPVPGGPPEASTPEPAVRRTTRVPQSVLEKQHVNQRDYYEPTKGLHAGVDRIIIHVDSLDLDHAMMRGSDLVPLKVSMYQPPICDEDDGVMPNPSNVGQYNAVCARALEVGKDPTTKSSCVHWSINEGGEDIMRGRDDRRNYNLMLKGVLQTEHFTSSDREARFLVFEGEQTMAPNGQLHVPNANQEVFKEYKKDLQTESRLMNKLGRFLRMKTTGARTSINWPIKILELLMPTVDEKVCRLMGLEEATNSIRS